MGLGMSMKGDNFSWIKQTLLAVIEFLSVSVFDWSLFSYSVFMSKLVSGRCLGSLALLCELKKVPFGRMNYRKVNFLGRHGTWDGLHRQPPLTDSAHSY